MQENEAHACFKTKKEEMKFLLSEYGQFEKEKYDFYYIIPFEWLKSWDIYMTDSSSRYEEI